MENIVAFLGLPRMIDRFKTSISEMTDLKKRGLIEDIIFVTWEERMEDKNDLRKYLSNNNIKMIERKESRFGGRGNIWHQMRALDIALDVIPNDSYVLKTRTDVHIDKGFLELLFSGELDWTTQPAGSDVFKNRIWVPFCKLQSPFIVCDFCFWGFKEDINKLFNYDARYDALYELMRGVAPTRRFIHPYLNEFPFLEKYLLNYRGPSRHHTLLRDRKGFIKYRIHSTVFGKILAFYYKCMMEDFYVEYDPVSFRNRNMFNTTNDQTAYSEAIFTDSFVDNFTQGPKQGRHDIICTTTSWFHSNFRDTINDDVPEVISEDIARSFGFWNEYKVDDDKMITELNKEDKFFHERYLHKEDLPRNKFTKLVADYVLEPAGLKNEASWLYRKFKRHLRNYVNFE